MKSVTEPGNLEDFLATAELLNDEFESQKANTVVLESMAFVQVRNDPTAEQLAEQKEFWSRLRVPRRPKWTREMAAEELHQMEADTFVEWRRNLSQVEEREHITMTPFEKNLNVWRQLWRVVEMADVLVQIVDARDPELFRCEDLERYAREVSPTKMCMLLLNKADLLTLNQRRLWAQYYESIGVKMYFFSAKQDENEMEHHAKLQTKRELLRQKREMGDLELDELLGDEDYIEDKTDGGDGDDDDDDNDGNDASFIDRPFDPNRKRLPEDIVGRQELLYIFSELKKEIKSGVATTKKGPKEPEQQEEDGRLMIGFCGYPNVGKSSTINKLMGEKRVTVSATPGKTKHFQTLFLNDDVGLLDCPGLVFPNFVTNRSTMVCSGLLPIDELRDYRGPGSIVCQRIKRRVLEAQYGIVLPEPDAEKYATVDTNRPPTVDELLSAYAFVRGFMGQSGAPNMARAARIILKDYVNGVLRYVAAPPGELGKHFDCQEGQEEAVQKKMAQYNNSSTSVGTTNSNNVEVSGDAVKKKPTYVEPSATPQAIQVSLLPPKALEKTRKLPKQERAKKRRGKGKHKGDVEHPYGIPPDPIDYAAFTAKK